MTAICQQCGASGNAEDRFCARCGTARKASAGLPTDPLLGRTVGGAYTLQELVGVGGMGRVYRAEQTALGRTVAVKVIHPHLLGDDRIVARFYNEARAASRLNHPNSVSIIDFGRTDDGILYLAMEHLEGKDLALVVHEEGPLPIARICRLLDGVLGALGEAHALDVVHRDLKPENIIVRPLRTGGDLVKVVDFGLATILTGEMNTAVTQAGIVCGTPDYMSPEQGRGDRVDGRGDVYALGVVLYELLTEQLPFEDETPTRVVLRHINDPVPSPIEAAPHRHIPEELGAIVMRAMAKDPGGRFQTADEMQRALRSAMERLRASDRAEITCPTCGERSSSSMRFCGSCGARLAPSGAQPLRRRSSPLPASYRPPRTSGRTFVGREAEMELLDQLRERASRSAVWAHVSGEQGVGRTRLVQEVGQRAALDGDRMIITGPHASRTPVCFHALRAIASELLGVPPRELREAASDETLFSSPLSRAGMIALTDDDPAPHEGARVGAVADALATLIRRAADDGRVVIVIDELDVCDGPTCTVMPRLLELCAKVPLLLVTTGAPGLAVPGATELPLLGLDVNSAGRFLMQREDDGRKSTIVSGRFMLPLYLEQIEVLGAHGGEAVPPRLADAIALRLDRLDGSSRKLLQAIAVLGDRCTLGQLRQLEGERDLSGLEVLHSHRLVQLTGEEVEIAHPFVRELVHTSTPAGARRFLHGRALALATETNAPLEVRAEHAFRSDEPTGALMLLERMGDRCSRRSDAHGAVLAYRRALELARREMLESGDPLLEGAILTFSRKLGEALEQVGEVVGADGVLREALDLAGPSSTERALMLLALGRVAAHRGRHREALRLLGLALEIAEAQTDPSAERRVHQAIARVRRAEGEKDAAITAYRRALENEIAPAQGRSDGAVGPTKTSTVLMAQLELAEVLAEANLATEARGAFVRVRTEAERAGAAAIAAAAIAGLAGLAAAAGGAAEAALGYRHAAGLAAEAGDADASARFRAAADDLTAASSHHVA